MTRAATATASPPQVEMRTLLWIGALALFLSTRLAAAMDLPAAGAELSGLAGAWMEHLGEADGRYFASLYQAAVSVLLSWEAEAGPARALAVGAALALPVSLFLVRNRLGEGPALLYLILLSLDPVTIFSQSTANPAAADASIAVALHAAGLMRARAWWLWGLLGALVFTAGPGPLVLAGALGATALARGGAGLQRPPLLAFAAGGAAGVAAMSLLAGGGGLRVPPLDVLEAGLSARWTAGSALQLSVLYELPVILGGLLSAAVLVLRRQRGRAFATPERLFLAWALAGAFYWVVAAGASDHSPILALTLPCAGLVATTLPPLTDLLTGRRRRLQAVAVSIGLGAAVLLLLPGTFAVARGGRGEPLLTPAETPAAHALHAYAVQLAEGQPGGIVIHPDVFSGLTWTFRRSGPVVVSSRIARGDAIVIWPAEGQPPPGYRDSGFRWRILREVDAPGPLDLVGWFRNRNGARESGTVVRLYTGVTP